MKILKNTLVGLSLVAVVSCGSDVEVQGVRKQKQEQMKIVLGAQIDRMGRPAINTALNNTFTSDEVRGAAEDDYNRTSNEDGGRFASIFAAHFAIYDGLVGECGDNGVTNRASADPADGLATGEGRYGFIGAVFADDQLYVNGNSSGCSQYLAAELGVIGVAGLESDCGGRTPLYDVIDTTYSAVAIGDVAGVGDGVDSDSAAHSDSVFPFLAKPNLQ